MYFFLTSLANTLVVKVLLDVFHTFEDEDLIFLTKSTAGCFDTDPYPTNGSKYTPKFIFFVYLSNGKVL